MTPSFVALLYTRFVCLVGAFSFIIDFFCLVYFYFYIYSVCVEYNIRSFWWDEIKGDSDRHYNQWVKLNESFALSFFYLCINCVIYYILYKCMRRAKESVFQFYGDYHEMFWYTMQYIMMQYSMNSVL